MIFTVIKKGDEVLLVISRILETSVDREDKIYRWGRRVSALFTPFAVARALILAEGIRQAVSEYQTLSVTVSIGVAEHHDGEAIDQLFPALIKRCMWPKMVGATGSRACRLKMWNCCTAAEARPDQPDAFSPRPDAGLAHRLY